MYSTTNIFQTNFLLAAVSDRNPFVIFLLITSVFTLLLLMFCNILRRLLKKLFAQNYYYIKPLATIYLRFSVIYAHINIIPRSRIFRNTLPDLNNDMGFLKNCSSSFSLYSTFNKLLHASENLSQTKCSLCCFSMLQ